ncbi:MAG: DUF748 domain-containing protein [Azoarcus sp.]|jgi:uncharacterized protein involved in outer membrane biogenesis|nr:DUF748 domain-containing protein [Azoarcus sp.]
MDSSAAVGPSPSSKLRRIVRPLIWAVFALLLYSGVGFIGIPLFARYYAPQFLGDLLGRTVSIEEVAFNPFTLAAEFRGLKVMEDMKGDHGEGSAVSALGFDRLMVNFEISSLWHGGPVVQELALGAPYARLVRLAEGRYNWSDVFERLVPLLQAEGDPALFSVANIHVEDGSIELEDRVTDATHRVSNLKLGIPVVSRLSVKAEVFIEPDLSMELDGQLLAAKGRLDPLPDGFQANLEQLTLKDFELPPWVAYLPFEPSFKLPSGALDLDMRVEFGQRADEIAKMTILGRAQVKQLAIQDQEGKPVLAVTELEVELADIQPLLKRYHFSKLRLQRPELDLVRAPDGRFNVESLLSMPPLADSQKPASGTAKAQKTASARAEASSDFQLSSARIRDGLIRYSDHAVAGGFSTRLEGISLDLRDLASKGQVPAEIRLDYTSASGERFSHQDRLRLQPFEYDGSLTVTGLQPALYGRYYTAFLSGGEIRRGSADGVFHYRIASQKKDDDAGDELLIEAGIERFELNEFVFGLSGRKDELLKLGNFTLTDAVIQPDTRQVQIGEINAQGVALATTRFANGRFDFMALAGKSTPNRKGTSPPWTFSLDKASVSNSSIRFRDHAAGEQPAVMTADDIELQLNGLTTAKGAAPANLTLRGRIAKEGRLALKGTFVPEPFRTDLEIDLQNFALPSVQPYIAQHVQLGIRTGRLSSKGRLALRQHRDSLRGSLAGNLSVRNFTSLDHANQQDFLRWNEFSIRQAKVELEPFAFAIGEVVVDGLASRLILDEKGRLNLREIQRSPEEVARADEAGDGEESEKETAATENAAPESWPSMKVGRIAVKNSNIAFTDRFVRPNYNVFVGNLSGELTGLSSDQDGMAKLDLQGKIGREAPVTIKGEFNPFRQDRRLNINVEVKDFELPGLSGYSGRYVGYGIARGKLSATLNYHIEDRKLSAENSIFLDQLTFGDAVDSPDATKLPVRLAVALLKNSRGEIKIDLPVGGTLDDPEFSVFGLVLRAFAGLIGKAITAPFALFGREELSQLDFDPGSFRIGAAQEEKLRDLAKSLEERPSLKLDITGQASAQRDTEGIRKDKLRGMVMAERRRTSGKNVPMDDIDPESEEYADLLDAVYSQAKIKKPRNFIGFAKSLPVKEMEKLLLESIDVKQEDVDSLAGRRETAVQRWLTDQGGIPPERLFRRALTEKEAEEKGREGNGVHFSLR